MPVKAKLDLEGFEEYLEDLAKAGKDIDDVADEALAAGGGVLVGGMQQRAPYSRIRSALGRSKVMRDGNKHYLYVGILHGTKSDVARVAAVWEYGGRKTPSPQNRGRKPRPGIRKRPFIRPTLRNDSDAAKNAMADVFTEWLDGE